LNSTANDPSGRPHSVGMYSIDCYFIGGGPAANNDTSNNPGIMDISTVDQYRRGCHYGSCVDLHRSFSNGQNTAIGSPMNAAVNIGNTSGAPAKIPLSTYLENQDGGSGQPSSSFITPPEMNWAMWSMLIHGARFIVFFAYSATGHGPANCGFARRVQSGQSIPIYQQGINCAMQIADLARIFNSPFALGYCAVSPHGYLFPKPENNWLNGGIELCVHWYQAGAFTGSHFYNGFNFTNGFYIFATTRNSETVTNTSATFTINDPNASSVNVIGESIPIVGGQFTDAFANAWTVHLYQVAREVFPRR
jgi:hypothetical protein